MAARFGEIVYQRTVKRILFLFALIILLSSPVWFMRESVNGDQKTKPHDEAHSAASESGHHGHAEGTAHEEGKEEHEHDGSASGQVLRLTEEEKANIGLKTVITDRRRIENVIPVAGVVRPDPDREAQVSSRVAGRIVAVFARVGDRVRRGQKLVEVESVEMQKIQVELIQAENRMLLSMAELNRIKRLVEKKIAAQKELIAAKNRHQAILNEIEGLSQRLVLMGLPREAVQRVRAEKSISTFAIRSPLSGFVSERHVVLGETVEPNKVIFSILDPSVVFVEGDAFEEALPQLRIGQRVRIRLASYPAEVFTGKISRLSPVIDPQKRTVHLWVEVPNPEGKLKPNLFANMDIVVGGGEKVLAIPLNTLITTEAGSFVFIEDGDSFRRAEVVLGAKDDRFIEVKRGLRKGDRVVADGKQQIYTQSLMLRQGGAALGGHQH